VGRACSGPAHFTSAFSWHDRKILPGQEWDKVINENLASADVVLFLISPGFLRSDYCRDVEVSLALNRAEKNEAVVIPIILVECGSQAEAFSRFQALPRDGVPLTSPSGAIDAELLANVVLGLAGRCWHFSLHCY
jgi:hypothetical protein